METIEHIIQRPEKQSHETPLFLQHGAWHGAWCWNQFLDYFASLGYEVHAISLPAEALNAKLIVFPGQAHNLMMEPGWQQVADTIDAWVTNELGLP